MAGRLDSAAPTARWFALPWKVAKAALSGTTAALRLVPELESATSRKGNAVPNGSTTVAKLPVMAVAEARIV